MPKEAQAFLAGVILIFFLFSCFAAVLLKKKETKPSILILLFAIVTFMGTVLTCLFTIWIVNAELAFVHGVATFFDAMCLGASIKRACKSRRKKR